MKALGAASTIFFSIILGAVAMAFTAVELPGVFEALQNGAGSLEDLIGDTGLDPKYNVWVKFLIDDIQLVFMGYVIVMRVLMSLAGGMFRSKY